VTGVSLDALRTHVLALAEGLGVKVFFRPELSVWEAEAFPFGEVDVPLITGILEYYCALHEIGHLAMSALPGLPGVGELDREHHAHAWARSVALVEPDERAVWGLEVAWRSHGGEVWE